MVITKDSTIIADLRTLIILMISLYLTACSAMHRKNPSGYIAETSFSVWWQDSTTGMKFRRIEAGKYMAGLAENDTVAPLHEIHITKPFWMSAYEVTQRQWYMIMHENPSQYSHDCSDCPVENVSWFDVKRFIEHLNSKTGRRYRLPSEAEWEYACRAGTSTPFATGHTLSTDQANYDGNWPYGKSSKGIFRSRPLPVGSFAPNTWGLYDMHGNVLEWCEDDYCRYNQETEYDPVRRCAGDRKIIRGGSWHFGGDLARSGRRYTHEPHDRGPSLGFRLVMEDVNTKENNR